MNICRLLFALCCLSMTLGPLTAAPVQFWAVGNGVEDSLMYRELAARFKKESGIDVAVTPLSWGNFGQKYMTSMAAGMPPDAGIANLGSPMEWGSVGGVVDLRKTFGPAFQGLEQQFFPGTLPQFEFRGHLYGMPTELVTTMLYYRRDLFAKLGLSPPRTWSELDRAIQKIEAAGYHFNFGWTRGEQWALYHHTLPFGKPGLWRDASGEPRLDWLDPAYQEGVLHALDLWHLHDSFGDGSADRTIGRFLADAPDESIGMMVDGNWLAGSIQNLAPSAADKWDVVPWPKADNGMAVNVMGGTSYVIFEASPRKQEAFAWLSYLNSVPAQQFMIEHRLARSGQASAFNIPPIRAIWAPDQAAFWAKPELQSAQKVIQVAQQITESFVSSETLKGKSDVDHIESKILDRMGTYTIHLLTASAEKHGLSRWAYIKGMAQGRYPGEREAILDAMRIRLQAEYATHAPLALAKVRYAMKSYDEDYGQIVDHLAAYARMPNILDQMKKALLALLIGTVLVVVLRRSLRQAALSYLFVSVPLVLALVFVLVPMLVSLYLSFTEYHSVLPLASAKWVGLKHYIESFQLSDSDNVIVSIGKTLLYVAITVPLGIVLALFFAALLNNPLRGQRFWRFLYFSPLITSAVSVALIFTQLYRESSLGWLNAFLLKLGFIQNPLAFLKDENSFLYCVMGLAVWHGLAFTILLFLAGLQQIPQQLYKAAEIDGAGWWEKFWHVSLPGIRPQLVFVAVMGLIGGFQVFEQIYMLGGGSGYFGSKFGPNDAGKTMVPLIYDLGFEQFKMGRASAVAYILFVVIFAFTLVQMRLLRQARQEA